MSLYLAETEAANDEPPWPTCRRHPRTTLEAFTMTAEYASAIEKQCRERDVAWLIVDTIAAVSLCACLGVLLAERFS